jgi:sulfane dehydrogenase subunit SoxC
MVEIEGLAWSGHGTIKGVDISFDGGDNWVEAKLKGLVLPKSWTRFSYIYKWDGNHYFYQVELTMTLEIFNQRLMKRQKLLV